MVSIQELLRDTIGFDTSSIGPAAVERAVRARLRDSGLDLREYVDLARRSSSELQALIEEIIVPETFFMRDASAFAPVVQVVREELLPERGRVVRLLSLPCSTGEEPYSMAMALLDAGVPPERFAIDGIDVSERALAKARQGVYGQNSFRGTSVPFRERFFDADASGWRLHARVRERVQVRHGNLFAPATLAAVGVYDVVFCRNLLIYFDAATQSRAIDVLEQLLVPQGLLVVAPSESHLLLSRPLPWSRHPGSFAFRRVVTAPPRRRRQPAAAAALEPPPVPRRAAAPVTSAAERPVAPEISTPEATHLEDATHLANQGRFSAAVQLCERQLSERGPSAAAFQLLGVLRDAMGNHDDALTCYRRALYLEPHNGEVLAHLALLLDRLDRSAEARIVRERHARLAGGARTS